MNDARLNLGLQTKLAQKIIITPQMKQSISLLQMPITELTQELNNFIEENPVLEIVEHEHEYSDNEDFEENHPIEHDSSLLDDLKSPEWDNYIDNGTSNELSFTPLNPDDEQNNFESYVSSDISISEHLLFQLHTSNLSDQEKDIGEVIIGNLSEDGYFRYDINKIAEQTDSDVELCKEVLDYIKQFDPAGIASECLKECILAQLPDAGASEGEIIQIEELFDNYSKELEEYRFAEIEKKSGLDKENLDELIALIRKTDPRPGLNFSKRSNNYILPDVYLVRNGNIFDVSINESGLPPLKLNDYYIKMMKEMKDGSAREYLEEKLKNAIWILKSLQKRQKAIYVVSKAIVDVQTEYLLKGDDAYLKPLRLKDIAEASGFSESTVSRVTNGKFIMTDHGLLELKSFFSKGMDSQEGDMSTRKIKTLIKSFIDSEPENAPYSDEKIVKLLSDEGVDIARRTVAKYRDELGIPTMSQRKRMRR